MSLDARARRAIAWAAFLAGCSPSVLWSGRSPDRATEALVTAVEGGEQLATGGRARLYDDVGVESLRWTARGVLVPARRGEAWWLVDGAEERGPFLAIGPIVVAGEHAAFAAEQSDGWHVTADGVLGEPFDVAPDPLWLDAESGTLAYVGRRRGAEQVVWGERVGPPCAAVALLSLGAKGRMLAYVDRGQEDRLLVDHAQVGTHEAVLELAVAAAEPHWAAITGVGDDCELVHDGRVLGRAPLLTHLRVSDDGAHVACLSPALDGGAIDVLLDGVSIAHHRRVDGESLTFVPTTAALYFVEEDTQGLRVVVDGQVSERFESIEGPVLAPARVGWIGRRGPRSTVVLGSETVAEEAWASSLQLADRGDGLAYVARVDGQRFVVTDRGRWPIPRFFIDTLVLDASGRHWGALVPDAGTRRLEVWVDGLPRAELDASELGGALTVPDARTVDAVRAIVRAELARAFPEP